MVDEEHQATGEQRNTWKVSTRYGLAVILMQRSAGRTRLTPTQNTEFEDVRGHVDVKDFYKREIHVNGFQAHPGERRQQEVVKQGGGSHAETVEPPGGEPGVEQKQQVEAQQSQGQVDEDLRGVVSPELSDMERRSKHGSCSRHKALV